MLVKKIKSVMKYCIPILLLFYVTSCAVNDYTSKITILNKSDISVNNIKVGDAIICSYIQPGGSFDYYFTTDLGGKLTGAGVISAGYTNAYDNNKASIVKRTGNYKLKHTGYFFDCEIFKVDSDYYITLRCDKKGTDYSNTADSYVNGGYYKD